MSTPATRFGELLNAQIGHEFAASQQYLAIASYYDDETLPRLASFFYAQALEERNHALMMVQYLLDADAPAPIPGVAAPQNGFGDVVDDAAAVLAEAPRWRRVTAEVVEPAGRTPQLSPVLIALFKGVLYQEQGPELWHALVHLQARVRDHAGVFGLELVLDEADAHRLVADLPSFLPTPGQEP